MRRDTAHKNAEGVANAASLPRGVNILSPNVTPLAELLRPRVTFRGDVAVKVPRDHLVIGPVGSRDDYLTVTFNPIRITTGCFTGTLEDLEAEVEERSEPHKTEYEACVVLIRALAATRAVPVEAEEYIAY